MRARSEAKSHRDVYGAGTRGGAGLDLVRIAGGRYRMGGSEVGCEGPIRDVRVLPFSIGRAPVSRGAYQLFLEENPGELEPRFWRGSPWSDPGEPVVGVSWDEARRFAAWVGCRLPSEAEWEYVGRLTDSVRRSLGIRDLFGKVAQWLEDDWHPSYVCAPEEGIAWVDAPRGML